MTICHSVMLCGALAYRLHTPRDNKKTMIDIKSPWTVQLDGSEDDFNDFEQAIPLLSEEEERVLSESKVPDNLPILPLKNTVFIPCVQSQCSFSRSVS